MQAVMEVDPVLAVMAFVGQALHVPAEVVVIPSAYVPTGHLQSVTVEVVGDDCALRTAPEGHDLHPIAPVAVAAAFP